MRGRTLGKVSHALGIPPEVLVNVPRVEIIGQLQLRLENHLGIEYYDPERIVIRVAGGYLVVLGQTLVVGWIDHNELLVTGRVRQVTLQEGK